MKLLDNYVVYNDATESSAPSKTAIETLSEALQGFSDKNLDQPGKNFILAINLGVLSNFVESTYGEAFKQLREYVINSNILTNQLDEKGYEKNSAFQHVSFSDYHMYNLTMHGINPEYVERILEKIFHMGLENPFYDAYNKCKECPLSKKCPVKHNYEFFTNEKNRKYVANTLVEVIIKDKEILTTREILNYIYDIVVAQNFNHKKIAQSLTNTQDINFKLFPYKASGKTQAPIITELEEVVSDFFRKSLKLESEPVQYESLCDNIITEMDIEDEDIEIFKEMIHSLFFEGDNFVAKNLGLYPYQTKVNNKSVDRLAGFLIDVLGLNGNDCNIIEQAMKNYPYNVVEKLVVDAIQTSKIGSTNNNKSYFPVVIGVQEKFKNDFYFMLNTGMTSLDDLSNLLAVYYFYYMSQACVTLDNFGSGKRNSPVQLYYALDWEKVSKNRKCCVEGWERIQSSANHMFSHAVTLEILNQHKFSGVMLDYISLQEYIEKHPDRDEVIASEIEKAEKAYTACVGDYKKFEQIPYTSEKAKTDIAIRHLYKCVEEQFLNTDRKRANQFYNEKFIEFCKIRWVKNRRKSGLVLNLTERDIIFLTKISIKGKDKIRLIDLYKEYEYRGIFLDNTSKEYLQDFFTKLNLIDKKSDSGDAQYVKRIL